MKQEPEEIKIDNVPIKDLNFRKSLINEILQDLEDAAYDFGRASVFLEATTKTKGMPDTIKSKQKKLYERASKDYNAADTKMRGMLKMMMGK